MSSTAKKLLPKDHTGTYTLKCFLSSFDFGTDQEVECIIKRYKQPALAILDKVVVSSDQVGKTTTHTYEEDVAEEFTWKYENPFDQKVRVSLSATVPSVYSDDGVSSENFRFSPGKPWEVKRTKKLTGELQMAVTEPGTYEIGKLIYCIDVDIPFKGIALLKAFDLGLSACREVVGNLFQEYNIEIPEFDNDSDSLADSITVPVEGMLTAKYCVGEESTVKKVS